MTPHLQTQLQTLAGPGYRELLQRIQRGLEKESLRITPEGRLAQTPHPAGLGSALTHPSITTDYSEALLEFITPVDTSIEGCLETLADVHSFTYRKIGDELLWATSMPCIVNGDDSIPVAEYGSANVARMKKVYRYGLGHRYGRLMQTIAGIHYNFSLPDEYWQRAWDDAGRPQPLQDYVTSRYLGLIRNFHRHSWLLIYLFGASPAVCASFLRGRDSHGLEPFDDKSRTLHRPYGTALRMGDLGYNSEAQKGLKVCYNSLGNYVQALRDAIMHPHPPYQAFPAGQGGDYQQLNDSLLQIENEFYSTIRPKRVIQRGERPLHALRARGVEYIEVRCLDLNPFHTVGIDASTVAFLDVFLLHCLLTPSAPDTPEAVAALALNQERTAERGRECDLRLARGGRETVLLEWAAELVDGCAPVALALDRAQGGTRHRDAVAAAGAALQDTRQLPSARVLETMAADFGGSYSGFVRARSTAVKAELMADPWSAEQEARYRAMAEDSVAAQRALEAADTLPFEAFRQQYLDPAQLQP